FKAEPYQIYFMIPGQVHSWAFEGHVNGYVINFSAAFFQSFLLNSGFIENLPFFNGDLKHAVINLPKALHEPITLLFEEIIKEAEGNEKVQQMDMLRVLMLRVFILISRLNTSAGSKGPASY